MTAGPRWPGAGPYRYQPVRLCSASGGTCTVPPASRPSFMTGAFTPIRGIRIFTGTERASGLAAGSLASRGGMVVIEGGMYVPPACADGLPNSPNAATLAPPAHATNAARAVPRARRPARLRLCRAMSLGQRLGGRLAVATVGEQAQ